MFLVKTLTVVLASSICTALPYYGGTRNVNTGSDAIIVEAPVSNNEVTYYPAVNLPANCRLRCVQRDNYGSPTTRCTVVRTSTPSSSRVTSYSSSDNYIQSYTPSRTYSTYTTGYRSGQDYSSDTSYSSYSGNSYGRSAQSYYEVPSGSQYESFMVKQDYPVQRMVMGYRAA